MPLSVLLIVSGSLLVYARCWQARQVIQVHLEECCPGFSIAAPIFFFAIQSRSIRPIYSH